MQFGGHEPPWSWRRASVQLAANAAGLWLAAALVPGIAIDDWQSLVAGTAIFAIVNTLVRPIAAFVSCCLIALTFGLFLRCPKHTHALHVERLRRRPRGARILADRHMAQR
ncbi:MAG: hypothetical protein EXR63_01980 [Dehalococcoidia bacterium]|nr:hypothetical protein [Dehalococcoidia bacterium]